MPDQKLFHFCRQISGQTDPEQLTLLIDELTKLLNEGQDAIKAKIRKTLSNHTGDVD